MSQVQVPSIVMLEVTQEDIDNGVRGNSYRCALARALRRQFPTAEMVEVVDHDQMTLAFADTEVTFVGPKAITGYLDRFDGFGLWHKGYKVDVKPTTFRLKVASRYEVA